MKNFFGTIIDLIVRNPLTTLFFVVLMVAAPGIFGVFALIIVGLLLFGVLSWALLVWRLRRVQRDMQERLRDQMRSAGAQQQQGGASRPPRDEGDVRVVATERKEKRVSESVGESVDFKEVE